MKKQTVKILSAVLGAAVLCTGVGAASYSAGAARTNPAPVSAASDADSMGNASGTSLYKDETVYAIAGADGSVEKVIAVSYTHLFNNRQCRERASAIFGCNACRAFKQS